MRLAMAIGMCGVVAACSGTIQDAGVTPLSAAPTVDGGSYTSGGGITVAVDVVEHNGLTAVCGVWAQSEQQSVLTKGKAKRVLGTGSVRHGDTVLVRGLTFMREVDPANSYAGLPANCVSTWNAWLEDDADDAVTIHIPSQVVYRDSDEDGEVIVRFEQTGTGAQDTALLGSIVKLIKS